MARLLVVHKAIEKLALCECSREEYLLSVHYPIALIFDATAVGVAHLRAGQILAQQWPSEALREFFPFDSQEASVRTQVTARAYQRSPLHT